jgi:hypothetical protein
LAAPVSWQTGPIEHGAAAMTLFMTLAFIAILAFGTLPVSGLPLGR